jgi:hypothetical protein
MYTKRPLNSSLFSISHPQMLHFQSHRVETFGEECMLEHCVFSSAEPFQSITPLSLCFVYSQNGNMHFCRLSSDSSFVSYRYPELRNTIFYHHTKIDDTGVYCVCRWSETDGERSMKYWLRLRLSETESMGLVFPSPHHEGIAFVGRYQ